MVSWWKSCDSLLVNTAMSHHAPGGGGLQLPPCFRRQWNEHSQNPVTWNPSLLILSMLEHGSKFKHVTWCWSISNHFLWRQLTREEPINHSSGGVSNNQELWGTFNPYVQRRDRARNIQKCSPNRKRWILDDGLLVGFLRHKKFSMETESEEQEDQTEKRLSNRQKPTFWWLHSRELRPFWWTNPVRAQCRTQEVWDPTFRSRTRNLYRGGEWGREALTVSTYILAWFFKLKLL